MSSMKLTSEGEHFFLKFNNALMYGVLEKYIELSVSINMH